MRDALDAVARLGAPLCVLIRFRSSLTALAASLLPRRGRPSPPSTVSVGGEPGAVLLEPNGATVGSLELPARRRRPPPAVRARARQGGAPGCGEPAGAARARPGALPALPCLGAGRAPACPAVKNGGDPAACAHRTSSRHARVQVTTQRTGGTHARSSRGYTAADAQGAHRAGYARRGSRKAGPAHAGDVNNQAAAASRSASPNGKSRLSRKWRRSAAASTCVIVRRWHVWLRRAGARTPGARALAGVQWDQAVVGLEEKAAVTDEDLRQLLLSPTTVASRGSSLTGTVEAMDAIELVLVRFVRASSLRLRR